jgi:mannose-6-phosphate isomerase-like protein (cupin superfamily)
MILQNLSRQKPFTTRDGSQIRSILDSTNAPVKNHSFAEATVPTDGATERHYHRLAEEIYFILEGNGTMEVDGEFCPVGPGDAILLPPGAWHQIRAEKELRFIVTCSPPYSHEDTYFE